jgi:hypothetical protein
MAEPQLDEFNTATRVQIMPSIADNFFRNGPVMRFVKEKRMKLFKGGTEIQDNFVYRSKIGGAYQTAEHFNVTRPQTRAGLRFPVKKYYVNVTEIMDDIEIELRTPEAAFDTVKQDLAEAALTLSAILELDIWKYGGAAGPGDRPKAISGFEEALNDGAAASYGGNTFPAYGNQSRVDGSVGNALKPAGSVANPVVPVNPGAITNHVMEHTYQSCVIGEEHPVLGVTSSRGMGYLNENYQGLQRLTDTVEPTIGWPGLKFKQATIVEGENDPILGNYLRTAAQGEIFAWLNPGPEGEDAHFRLHVSASPKFQFGFTGFKPAQDTTIVAGQVLVACQFVVRTPRLMRIFYGFAG